VLLVSWPDTGEAPLEERLRAAIGPSPNLLVLRAPEVDLVADAIGYAAAQHPTLGPAFEADAFARLAHFDKLGIRELVPTLVIVERSAEQGGSSGGWTGVVPIEPLANVSIASARIEGMLAGRALARRGEAALLEAKLRAPVGTELSQVQVGFGAEVPSTLSARFSPQAGIRGIQMTMEALFLLTVVEEAPNVREAIPRCAEMLEIPVEQARPKLLTAVVEGLDYGLLEIVS
jgi:hypothetical protein